jgi:hypothetical protein
MTTETIIFETFLDKVILIGTWKTLLLYICSFELPPKFPGEAWPEEEVYLKIICVCFTYKYVSSECTREV